MSRYLILFLLNLPFILAAILSSIVNYKMDRISQRRMWGQVVFWLLILVGLATAEALYEWLFSNDLTQTEPLSLFDVVQITAIVVLLYVVTKFRNRLDSLEEKFKKFNSEISIELSRNDS